ncbi:hypothetical protein UlMin_029785 [Ulmus minor]
MKNFQEALDQCCLRNLPSIEEFFTWDNKQLGSDFLQERLDCYVSTLAWGQRFPNSQFQNLKFYSSDHRAIKIILGPSHVWVRKESNGSRKGRFHFEELWTTDEECRLVVSSAWGKEGTSDKMVAVVNGLQRCAKETDVWGFQKYGRVKKQIADLRHNIEAKKTDKDHGPSMIEISDMENNLECLLDKEEIYWKQRSRTDWLTHGDRNSKVFHHKASKRRRKNYIEGLKNMEGEWCTGIDNISNVVTDYFDKLFSSSTPSLLDMDTVFSCVKPKVSQSMNEHMSHPFTGEEIWKALADMPPYKIPWT